MIRTVSIANYRCFKDFNFPELGRINLFVGKNNSGKTTALEAIHLLASGGNPEVLIQTMSRRGEVLPVADERERRESIEYDPGFLFGDHVMVMGSQFVIAASDELNSEEITCSLYKIDADTNEQPLFKEEYAFPSGTALYLRSRRSNRKVTLPLSRDGGIGISRSGPLRSQLAEFSQELNTNYIATESLATWSMARMWDAIALTPEEEEVLNALRILDDRVERMSFLALDTYRPMPVRNMGIVLKLRGTDYRMPLGSMGDGMRRILALSLSVIKSKGGVLFIDEIDTGFHYSVMGHMWKMLINTAMRNSVQVFATTHSQDCVNELAWICEQSPDLGEQVKLQRVDANAKEAVVYSAEEISEASRRHLELR